NKSTNRTYIAKKLISNLDDNYGKPRPVFQQELHRILSMGSPQQKNNLMDGIISSVMFFHEILNFPFTRSIFRMLAQKHLALFNKLAKNDPNLHDPLPIVTTNNPDNICPALAAL